MGKNRLSFRHRRRAANALTRYKIRVFGPNHSDLNGYRLPTVTDTLKGIRVYNMGGVHRSIRYQFRPDAAGLHYGVFANEINWPEALGGSRGFHWTTPYLEAECSSYVPFDGMSNVAPCSVGHMCGINMYNDANQLMRRMYSGDIYMVVDRRQWLANPPDIPYTSDEWIPEHKLLKSVQSTVFLGLTLAWGQTVVHRYGYRAQHAEVQELLVLHDPNSVFTPQEIEANTRVILDNMKNGWDGIPLRSFVEWNALASHANQWMQAR